MSPDNNILGSGDGLDTSNAASGWRCRVRRPVERCRIRAAVADAAATKAGRTAAHDRTARRTFGPRHAKGCLALRAVMPPSRPLRILGVLCVEALSFFPDRGEKIPDGFLGVGGAHDFSHDGDAARAGGKAGCRIVRVDTAERDDWPRREARRGGEGAGYGELADFRPFRARRDRRRAAAARALPGRVRGRSAAAASAEPAPDCLAYTSFLFTTAHQEPWEVLVAALLP